jgi:serine/threonine protein kinase
VQTTAKKEEGTITIVGSYGYIPLEQFGGQTTTASDLYSLGMTLIYLLTGTHPAELPQVDGRVKFNAEISKRFERWLEKMTHPHLDKRFDSAKAAQLALKSEDGSYGNFDRLKPAHTQIRLYRDRNRLQITWHEANESFSYQVLLGLLFYLLIIITISHIPSLWYMWFFLLLAGLTLFLQKTNYFSKTNYRPKTNYHLIIGDRYIYNLKDHNQGHESTKLSRHLRSQIEILAYNPGYTFNGCLDTNGKLIQGNTITIPPKLYLYCGNFEYSFPAQSSSTEFSQAELWWLGQELSDFLNLELQVIYPTPKVPPAPSCGGGC